MPNVISEEQQLFRESLRRLLQVEYPFAARQAAVTNDQGISRALQKSLAGLGVMSIPFDSDLGGLDGDGVDIFIAFEGLGGALAAEPALSTLAFAGTLLAVGATEQQQHELLPAIMSGDAVYGCALYEAQSRYNLANVRTTATAMPGGFSLSGIKSVVYCAPVADKILLTARTSGASRDREGVSVFVVDASTKGLARRDYQTMDGFCASEIVMEEVFIPETALIGELGNGLSMVEQAFDHAVFASCAEAVGAMEQLILRTIRHCKDRQAFGQAISEFQVVQHRIVDMQVAYEHAVAVTLRAARSLGMAANKRSCAVSAAKFQVGKEMDFVGKNAVQLHGAMGMTDELDVGHYFKRLVALGSLLGDGDYHLNRYIAASDYPCDDNEGSESDNGFMMTREDKDFRDQIRRFIKQNLTDEMKRAAHLALWCMAEFEYGKQWQRVLHQHGMGAVAWPVEYGGKGWSRNQLMIWNMEYLAAGAPVVMLTGREICAPCIMEFGTEEQKQFFLPRILSGEDWWSQGFSEPSVGSDLRALRLKAEIDGDDFVLNGSKIWATFAQFANRMLCLVRSGSGPKKHDGISVLLIDMDSPGIEVRPITTIAGEDEFCEVFFTDVRVSKSRLLGPENDGWQVVRYLLQYEHGGAGGAGAEELAGRLSWLNEIAAMELDGEDQPLADNPDFQRRLAELTIEVETVNYAETELRRLTHDGASPETAELLTIRRRNVVQAISELAMRAVGTHGLPQQVDARKVAAQENPIGPEYALTPMPYFLAQRAVTIAGGTNEIHRNNVARQLLN